MMINKEQNTTEEGEKSTRNIITTKNRTRRSLIERYERKFKERSVSKFNKNIKYIGVPIERANEIMGGIRIGGEGEVYPQGEVKWIEAVTIGLEVKRGGVAAWASKSNKGLFLKAGFGIKAWTIIGIYDGLITTKEGLYVLEVEGMNGGLFRIDGEEFHERRGLFGKINEDIHKGEVNVLLEDMGLIISCKDMIGPC